jgi:hypothetical protein
LKVEQAISASHQDTISHVATEKELKVRILHRQRHAEVDLVATEKELKGQIVDPLDGHVVVV